MLNGSLWCVIVEYSHMKWAFKHSSSSTTTHHQIDLPNPEKSWHLERSWYRRNGIKYNFSRVLCQKVPGWVTFCGFSHRKCHPLGTQNRKMVEVSVDQLIQIYLAKPRGCLHSVLFPPGSMFTCAQRGEEFSSPRAQWKGSKEAKSLPSVVADHWPTIQKCNISQFVPAYYRVPLVLSIDWIGANIFRYRHTSVVNGKFADVWFSGMLWSVGEGKIPGYLENIKRD